MVSQVGDLAADLSVASRMRKVESHLLMQELVLEPVKVIPAAWNAARKLAGQPLATTKDISTLY